MDAARTGLLVMDVQDGIVERLGNPAQLERLAAATAAARAAGVRIVHVVVGFRDGYPEISSRNRAFSQLAGSSQLLKTSVHESVAPAPGEAVVTKRRVSAFAGSDLDVILRAYETQSLVLTGISTSGVVLSTLRQAADLDFDLIVESDGCADGDHEVHRMLLQKVFPRQAAVMTVDEWSASLDGSAAARG
jgi:nicotinamidase-related amidase